MSILPLSGILGLGLSFFLINLEVWETIYVKEDGIDKQVVQGKRIIQAGVDPSNMKRLEQLFGGSVSDGDIGITTSEALSIIDVHVGDQQRQTYARYHGIDYRIADHADWTDQAGLHVYLAKRHVTQDLL